MYITRAKMLTIKKISNHKETIKYGVVKGFEDRDRASFLKMGLTNEKYESH